MVIKIKQKLKTAAARVYFNLAYFTLPKQWRKVYKRNVISSKQIVAYTQKRCIPITTYVKWLRRKGFVAWENQVGWFEIATKQLEINEGGDLANERRMEARKILEDWKKFQKTWKREKGNIS